MRRRGLTLVESVLALTLISLALVAFVAAFNTALLLSARNRHQAQADQLLEAVLEFYAQDYVFGYGNTVYTLEPYIGEGQLEFRRQFRLSNYSSNPPVRRLEAEVRWNWKRQSYQKQRVRLLCRPGR